MAMAMSGIQTGINTKVNLRKVRLMGKEFITGILEKFMMENGVQGLKTEMEFGKE